MKKKKPALEEIIIKRIRFFVEYEPEAEQKRMINYVILHSYIGSWVKLNSVKKLEEKMLFVIKTISEAFPKFKQEIRKAVNEVGVRSRAVILRRLGQ